MRSDQIHCQAWKSQSLYSNIVLNSAPISEKSISLSNLHTMLQIQIKNKAYYLKKTKLLSIKKPNRFRSSWIIVYSHRAYRGQRSSINYAYPLLASVLKKCLHLPETINFAQILLLKIFRGTRPLFSTLAKL